MVKSTKNMAKNMDDFEIDLFKSLRSYGYLFPVTREDVDRFEELYGDTDIESPEIDEIIDTTLLGLKESNQDVFMLDAEFNIAAFSSDEDENNFTQPDTDSEFNENDKV